MSISVQSLGFDAEIESGMRQRTFASCAIVLFALTTFATWSAFAPLSSAVVAGGIVNPDSRTKTVQHLEGGIIREILVSDGSLVAAGQDLLILDDTRARASVAMLSAQYRAALATETRLTAERDHLDRVAFPPELLAAAVNPEVQQSLAAESARFDARRDALAGEKSILEQRILQLNEEMAGWQAQRVAADGQLALLGEEIQVVQKLVADGHERKPRLLALQRAAKQTEGERGRFMGEIARTKQGIGEARLRISQLSTTMSREVADELKEVQNRRYDLQERLRAAEDSLTRTRIKAPQAGTVVRLGFFTPEGVIPPAAAILDIVPADDRTIVEARIRPDDINNVRVGMSAQVWPTAFNLRRTPPLSGVVEYISADRIVERGLDKPYYFARIEIDPQSAAHLPNGIKALIPGMPTEVIVESDTHTLMDYILSPISRSMRHAFREK